MTDTGYVVCDRCGHITEVDRPRDTGWLCDKCPSTSAWWFADRDYAERHAAHIADHSHEQAPA